MVRILTGLAVLLLTAGAAVAESPTLELDARYWLTNLTMKAKVTQNGVGTDINFVDQLGLGDENFADVRLLWYTGPESSIRLAYNKIGFDGSRNITEQLVFDGKTYTINTPVSTSVDVENYRLGWTWQFVQADEGRFRFGTVLELKGFVVDARLAAPALNINEADKVAGALPTVGLAANWQVHPMVDLFGEIGGISAGSYGYFLDGEAGVKFVPVENFSIIGGYRVFDLKAENNNDYARLKFAGPFVGATAWF